MSNLVSLVYTCNYVLRHNIDRKRGTNFHVPQQVRRLKSRIMSAAFFDLREFANTSLKCKTRPFNNHRSLCSLAHCLSVCP